MKLDYSLINEANKEIRKIEWALHDLGKPVRLEDKIKQTQLRHRLGVLMALIAHTRGRCHLANTTLEAQEKFLSDHKDDWEYLVKYVELNKTIGSIKDSSELENRKKKSVLDRIIGLL